MKKLTLLLLSFVCIAASAQTADDIIQQYSAAMGGLDAFNKISTAKITGTVTTQGRTLPIITQMINNKAMRMDVEAMGQQIINVYNNGKGWKINPFANAPVATEVKGSELTNYKAQASLLNNLADYRNRGHQVEYLGQEDVNGSKVYKIKLTSKDDVKTTTYFISTSSYFLIKSVTKREIQGNQYDAETIYTDIREINGLKFCMHITVTVEGNVFQEVNYEKIELNIPVDEKIFLQPK